MFIRCFWGLDSPVDLIPVGAEPREFEARSQLLEALVGSGISNATFSAEPLEFVLAFSNGMMLKLCLDRPIFPEADNIFGPYLLSVGFRDIYWSSGSWSCPVAWLGTREASCNGWENPLDNNGRRPQRSSNDDYVRSDRQSRFSLGARLGANKRRIQAPAGDAWRLSPQVNGQAGYGGR